MPSLLPCCNNTAYSLVRMQARGQCLAWAWSTVTTPLTQHCHHGELATNRSTRLRVQAIATSQVAGCCQLVVLSLHLQRQSAASMVRCFPRPTVCRCRLFHRHRHRCPRFPPWSRHALLMGTFTLTFTNSVATTYLFCDQQVPRLLQRPCAASTSGARQLTHCSLPPHRQPSKPQGCQCS